MRMNKIWGLLAVLLVVTAACGSNKKADKTAASDNSTTSTTLVTGDTTTSVDAGTTATTAAGKTASTAKGATVTTTKATTANGVPTPAAPGTYDYTQSGTTSIPGSQVPTSTMITVDAPNGTSQVSHIYVDPSQPANDMTINYSATGPFITDLVVRGAGQQYACHFDAPVPSPPWPATDGKPIAGHATCGPISVDIAGSITGHKTQAIAGKSFDVIVGAVTLTTHGQIESTSKQEQWWSPALRMPTHVHMTTNGKYGAFAFNSDVTTDLKSPTPR